MVRERVRRLANPRRRTVKRKRTTAKRNAKGRFVRRTRKTNPRRKAVKRRRTAAATRPRKRVRVVRRKRSTRSNPVSILTLGAINPKRRRKVKVARRKTRSRTRTNPRRRRRNATRIVVVSPRRRNARRRVSSHRRRRVIHRRRRSNPGMFGAKLGSAGSFQMILGGLVGVTAAKLIPTWLPASLVSSPIMRVVVTGASAVAASMAAAKMAGGHFADAVMFGGLMQTGSVALNVFLPSVGGVIGLAGGRGMGDLVDGHFVVPQNPLRYIPPPPMPAQARVTMNGLTRAFGTAF